MSKDQLKVNVKLWGRQGRTGTANLLWAARRGHLEIVMLLLEKGAARDLKDKTGETALQKAKGKGHQSVVDLLTPKDRGSISKKKP